MILHSTATFGHPDNVPRTLQMNTTTIGSSLGPNALYRCREWNYRALDCGIIDSKEEKGSLREEGEMDEQPFHLPETAEELSEWYDQEVAGTLDSGWPFLRQASASSYLTAAQQLSGVAAAWRRNQERPDSTEGEGAFILTSNYGFFASGPLLAATLLPSFAIDGFLSLCANAAFVAEGLSGKPLVHALNGFDRQSFAGRIEGAVDLSGAVPLPRDLRLETEELIQFRNSVAHDTPALNIPGGGQISAKKGKVREARTSTSHGYYPALFGTLMPLDLSHPRRAIRTHDELVDHVLNSSRASFSEAFSDIRSASDLGSPRIDGQGGTFWEEARRFNEYWLGTVVHWHKQVPLEASTDFVRGIHRRSVVRLEPDSED